MRTGLAIGVRAIVLAGGCKRPSAELGEECDLHRDCENHLQCRKGVCAERSQEGERCGDYELVEIPYPFFLTSGKKAQYFQVVVTAL